MIEDDTERESDNLYAGRGCKGLLLEFQFTNLLFLMRSQLLPLKVLPLAAFMLIQDPKSL